MYDNQLIIEYSYSTNYLNLKTNYRKRKVQDKIKKVKVLFMIKRSGKVQKEDQSTLYFKQLDDFTI